MKDDTLLQITLDKTREFNIPYFPVYQTFFSNIFDGAFYTMVRIMYMYKNMCNGVTNMQVFFKSARNCAQWHYKKNIILF